MEKKPRQNIAVPSSVDDLQAILDNLVNNSGTSGYAEFVADNFYWASTIWNGSTIQDRMHYIWDQHAVTQDDIWISPYYAIYNANFVLDYLQKVSQNGVANSNNVKGAALFYRSFMFHQLAQLFCMPYSNTASSDQGVVLRLTAAIEQASVRSTVEQTYQQIINDLKIAADILPVNSLYTTRPNKAAAYGELARVYLSMRDYSNAEIYANMCLNLNATLLDFNTLSPASAPVLPGFQNNPEILFLSVGRFANLFAPSLCNIDSNLIQSYQVSDLRKNVFFGANASSYYWKGNYAPDFSGINYSVFEGIAIDEIYLIRAECRARAGSKDAAMSDLNMLLKNRWKTGTFTDLTAATLSDALSLVLLERRKELLFRGLRWSDLRRFNVEGAGITLKRIVNNTAYSLYPNDSRWALLIPEVEISRSGIQQNLR